MQSDIYKTMCGRIVVTAVAGKLECYWSRRYVYDDGVAGLNYTYHHTRSHSYCDMAIVT